MILSLKRNKKIQIKKVYVVFDNKKRYNMLYMFILGKKGKIFKPFLRLYNRFK